MVTPRTDPETIHEQPTETEVRGAGENVDTSIKESGVQTATAPEAENVSPAQFSQETKDPSGKNKKLAATLGGITLAAISAVGIGRALSDVESTPAVAPEPQPTTTQPSNTEASPQNPEAESSFEPALPNSNDPQELAEQLYENYEKAFNTGTPKYLDFVYIGGRERQYVQNRIISRINQDIEYRQVEPQYKREYTATVLDDPATPGRFGDNDIVRTITVEIKEEITNPLEGDSSYTFVHEYTLKPKEVPVNKDGTTEIEKVWLIGDIDDLGDVVG